MERYELAEKDYMKGMKYKEIAEKYDVTINTVKSWKTRYKWSRDGMHTQAKSVHTRKKQGITLKVNKEILEEPVIENDELTDKQRLFCLYYLKYFNATKAYQKAYGCAYTTAAVEGHRHLKNPKINAEIDRLKAEQAAELKLDVKDVLQKYIDIAFADITDFATFGKKEIEVVNDLGKVEKREVNYVDFKESTEVDGTIITEVKQGRDGVSVKLADKMKALEFLSKYTDLLNENDRKKLQDEKLKVDIEKARAEVKELSHDGGDKIIIITNEDEMRAVLNERNKDN